MAPTLTQMRSFVAISKVGSFTRAAHAIHLSQPALTVQIRQLEETLQVKLLDRNTRTVHLTRVGQELAPLFERVLHELDTIVAGAKQLANQKYGIVRIACLPSLAAAVLPAAIREYRQQHPGVEFVLRDGVGNKVLSLVKADLVDFGIAAAEVNDPDFETEVLMRDRIHAVYLAPHPLDRERSITAAKLSRHPLILMDSESTVRQVVERGFRAEGLAIAPLIEATYMATAVGMVRARLGVALLPSVAVEAKASGQLRSRPVAGRNFSRPIIVVRKKGRTLPPASAAFLAMLARE
jgi:DNA-binding transcriptional LysR family regulator